MEVDLHECQQPPFSSSPASTASAGAGAPAGEVLGEHGLRNSSAEVLGAVADDRTIEGLQTIVEGGHATDEEVRTAENDQMDTGS